jgi:Phospholipase_D-nuclease N-terminal
MDGTWHVLKGDPAASGGDLTDPKFIGLLAAVLCLLAAALIDIKRRPASQIRGSKRMWTAASLINWFIGPVAYFIFGRRRRRQRA